MAKRVKVSGYVRITRKGDKLTIRKIKPYRRSKPQKTEEGQ